MNLKVVNTQKEAKGTLTVFFEKPHKFKFLPGQYLYLTIPEVLGKDSRGPTREFTISGSPTEEYLRITSRIRDESTFKQFLKVVKPGTVLMADGPSGTFILDEYEKGTHVLIAGGIGVTPFRSYIKYNIDKRLTDIKLHLIYSNSIPEEIAFREELQEWDKNYPNIEVTMTVTKPEESTEKWTRLTGRIDENLLKSKILNLKSVTFWLCGPPGLVNAMEKVLGGMKITADRIRTEKFTGY